MANRNKMLHLFVSIILTISLATVFASCSMSNDDENEPAETQISEEYLKEFIAAEAETIRIREVLSQNSAFAQVYLKTRLAKLTNPEDTKAASESIDEEIIQNRAIIVAAKNEGITVSDEEVKALMDEIVETGKNDDDYEQMQELCEANDVSFEDTVYKNEAFYRLDCIRSKLYETKGFKDVSNWDDYLFKLEKDYEKSEDCNKFTEFIVYAHGIMDKAGNRELSQEELKAIKDIDYFE